MTEAQIARKVLGFMVRGGHRRVRIAALSAQWFTDDISGAMERGVKYAPGLTLQRRAGELWAVAHVVPKVGDVAVERKKRIAA